MTRIEPAGFGKNRRTGGFHLTRAVRRRRGDPAASSQQLQPEFVRHSPPRRSSCLLVAYCLQVVSRESPPPVSLFSALLVPPSLQGPAVQPSRTLLDPVFLSTCLAKPLIAVTYSLSKVSEFIAPIRIVTHKG
ncbi:hypothetical protein AHAS_Ahas15G0298800 [Arachis hypogaea]